MFGLMRRAARLPYCGTCKSLGTLYGQRTRVLLNHDIVFLAELLLEYAGEPQWDYAYRSYNCFSLPKAGTDLPAALEYAATATVCWRISISSISGLIPGRRGGGSRQRCFLRPTGGLARA